MRAEALTNVKLKTQNPKPKTCLLTGKPSNPTRMNDLAADPFRCGASQKYD